MLRGHSQLIMNPLTLKAQVSIPALEAQFFACFFITGVVPLTAILWSTKYRTVRSVPMPVTQPASINGITTIVPS